MPRASGVSVSISPEIYATRMNSLPQGIQLEAGQLTAIFASPEQLLERLFALAQALANDLYRIPVLRGEVISDV